MIGGREGPVVVNMDRSCLEAPDPKTCGIAPREAAGEYSLLVHDAGVGLAAAPKKRHLGCEAAMPVLITRSRIDEFEAGRGRVDVVCELIIQRMLAVGVNVPDGRCEPDPQIVIPLAEDRVHGSRVGSHSC